jgi:hypothetical protein
MPDASSVERELNELQEELKKAVRAGMTPLGEKAKAVHDRIREACSSGFQVEAHKDGGRILRMQVVGGLRRGHTQFKYMRFAETPVEEEDCELASVDRFKVKVRSRA